MTAWSSPMRAICGRSAPTAARRRASRRTRGMELFAKFSPDGSQLAFTGQYGGDEQVYVMPSNGGAPRQLTYYPTPGPLPERWEILIIRSTAGRPTARRYCSARRATAIIGSIASSTPCRRPEAEPPRCRCRSPGPAHFSPDGRRIVYSPLWRDFRSEKRYQGGWANDLYIFDLGHPALTRVTDDPRTDRDPMWIGSAVYFNSDRSGVFNLYRYDVDTQQTTQVTHYTDWDVRWPSADAEGQIVYELDGVLHIYDTRTDKDRTLDIEVPTDDTSSRPQMINAADNIESLALSPLGGRVAIVARGDVFGAPGTRRNSQSDPHLQRSRARGSLVGRRAPHRLRVRRERRRRTVRAGTGRRRAASGDDFRTGLALLRASVVGRRQAHRNRGPDRPPLCRRSRLQAPTRKSRRIRSISRSITNGRPTAGS